MGLSMVYTGTSLLRELSSMIGDPTSSASPRWGQAVKLGWLNRGLQKVTIDTETLVESEWTTDTVAAQKEYELPQNWLMDQTVMYEKDATDHRKLIYFTIDQMTDFIGANPDQSGDPAYYWFWRRLGGDITVKTPPTMRLYPVPGTAEAGLKIRVFGWKLPDEILATNLDLAIELEAPFCELVLLYAAKLARQDDREPAMAAQLRREYIDQLKMTKGIRAKKSRSKRPRIRARSNSPIYAKELPWKPVIWPQG